MEDCLYLNVHAPTGIAPASGFPVMVWCHGGAFNTGGTITYINPSPMVNEKVIVVPIAYRMGPSGFLAHPALRDADGGSGDYGLMDQQAALKWVKANIAKFGGDPNNVTIFGESAGGFSVMNHLASPLSQGLFQKAIVESGAYAFDRQLTQAAAETLGTTVVNNALTAASITCPGGTVDAACLRGLPVDVVAGALSTAFNTAAASPVPSLHPTVLPKSIKAAFADGSAAKVPMINGSNMREYSLFIAITENARRVAMNNFNPADTSLSLTAAAYPTTLGGLAAGTGHTGAELMGDGFYPLSAYGDNVALQPSLGASAAGTDVIFACNAWNLSKRQMTQGTPIWQYEFRPETALPSIGISPADGAYYISFPQGAGHSYELQYLFQLRTLPDDSHRALQSAMARYWTNFAKTGNPNNGNAVAVQWPAFAGEETILGLDVAAAGGIKPLESSFDNFHGCARIWSMLTF